VQSCEDDSIEDVSANEEDHSDNVTSAWRPKVDKIKDVIEGKQALAYLRDVERVVDVLQNGGVKACKYTCTRKMSVNDRSESERKGVLQC